MSNFRFGQLPATMALLVGCSLVVSFGCGGSSAVVVVDPLAAYNAANGMTGGKYFDSFWLAQTGWDQADPNLARYVAKPDFFKCKQCHGWDFIGNKGAYINRAATASRPNVHGLDLRAFVTSHTPQEIFDAVKRSTGRRAITTDISTYHPTTNPTVGDLMPDYSTIMTDAQIWAVVKFMKVESLDTTLLYDQTTTGAYPTGTIAYSNVGKDGDATAGDTLYVLKCRACHGNNGKALMFGTTSLGKFMRTRPNEAQHKIKFGQLGSAMGTGGYVTTLVDMKNLYKAMLDTTKYPD